MNSNFFSYKFKKSKELDFFCYLIMPINRQFEQEKDICWIDDPILQASLQQAQFFLNVPVEVLFFNSHLRQLWSLNHNREVSVKIFKRKGIHCLINLGFLCSDHPPVTEMLAAMQQHNIAWCGLRSSHDIYACILKNKIFRRNFSTDFIERVIKALTITNENDSEDVWPDLSQDLILKPNSSCFEYSPALEKIPDLYSKQLANAAKFLNTAIQEILGSPHNQLLTNQDPNTVLQRLIEQRSVSQVPWIFNTLINEIEYRTGVIDPQSFPPEIHLSTTGFCNVECRFCSYTRSIGRFEFVTTEQIAKLDFLKYVQTLRLHSGLGEPTTNQHLPDIIRYVAQHYPHVGINFFTNGLNLNRPGMIDALIGNVRWINVSLNAASRESWRQQFKIDQFHRVCENLTKLLSAKKAQKSLWPLVFGSMVINKDNVMDLPLMPALCHQLGIDRFTVFPFFALGYGGVDKYGADMTLATCRQEYDELYWPTIEAAQQYKISIEMPPPSQYTKTAFGLEVRQFNDFAKIETNEWPMGRFLSSLVFSQPPSRYCYFLWRQVGIGSTHNCGHSKEESHYLYPCIGPLSGLDLSRKTSFRFPNSDDFLKLWNHSIFTHLRTAQHQEGICEVCDLCRKKDTRDPNEFECLENAVDQFRHQYVDNLDF